MRKIMILSVVLISLISCDSIFKERSTEVIPDVDANQYAIGGDEDEDGCVISAGYTWSVLKNDCVRVFEIGYRLNPVHQEENESAASAFVIFNENKDKAEIFLPTEKGSFVLNKKEANVFVSEKFTLNTKEYTLLIDGVKKYEAAQGRLRNINDVDNDMNDTLRL